MKREANKPPKSDEEWGKFLEELAPGVAESTEEFAFPEPKPSKLRLTESSQKMLNAARKTRAMQEAFEVGRGLFVRAPDFMQKQVVDLILIINSISAAHPRARKKIVGRIIDGCLFSAAAWLRERQKGAGAKTREE